MGAETGGAGACKLALPTPLRPPTPLLLLIFSLAHARADRLVQVQVVTRHGARTPLVKTSETLLEGGSSLTPLGEKQHYDLGGWLRSRYFTQERGYPLYDPARVKIRSSAFDRTIVSAQSLALGLFPAQSRNSNVTGESLLPPNVSRANIPVFTKDAVDDVEIRAYANCPAFHQSLANLYESPSFKAREQDHIALLQKLGEEPTFSSFSQTDSDGKNYVPLSQVWNAFDAINVAKTECEPSAENPVCKSLPDPNVRNLLSQQQWLELSELSHTAEFLKYGPANAGSMLGANLLFSILSGMKTALRGEGQRPSWIVYSGHYPTLLGMFSALNTYDSNQVLRNESIPNYASALIFELWESSQNSDVYARMMYKEGLQQNVKNLSFGEICQNRIRCPLISFENGLLNSIKESDASSWCGVCENKNSSVCLRTLESESTCKEEENDVSTAVALSIFGGILAGCVLGSVGCFCILSCIRRQQRGKNEKILSVQEQGSVGSVVEEQKVGEVGELGLEEVQL